MLQTCVIQIHLNSIGIALLLEFTLLGAQICDYYHRIQLSLQ